MDQVYIVAGIVSVFTNLFPVMKCKEFIRMIYDSYISVIYKYAWKPNFGLTSVYPVLDVIDFTKYMGRYYLRFFKIYN